VKHQALISEFAALIEELKEAQDLLEIALEHTVTDDAAKQIVEKGVPAIDQLKRLIHRNWPGGFPRLLQTYFTDELNMDAQIYEYDSVYDWLDDTANTFEVISIMVASQDLECLYRPMVCEEVVDLFSKARAFLEISIQSLARGILPEDEVSEEYNPAEHTQSEGPD
jgi:ribonucleotide reductase alpha subunit